MRFLLIDGHKIIREGLRQILLIYFPAAVCDEGSNAEDVIEKITATDYDVVICDLSMPGRSGLDVLQQVKKMRPDLPVLILSMHPEEHYALRALKAGAWGYINKSDGADVLIPAVQKVLQGRKYISPSIAEQMAENLNERKVEADQPHENLSSREFDVFRLLVEGKSIADISQQLTLSPSTVSTHRARILTKMKVKNNAELIKYAIQHNLI
ncbi:MAG TPA: response regulator transcription factor [Flavisolibacter sp.]|nr:response regulator transcription factor [Flavisolibacter sp.]